MSKATGQEVFQSAVMAWRTWPIATIFIAFFSFFVGALLGMAAIEGLKAAGAYPAAEWANVVLSTTVVFGASIIALLAWVRFFERKQLAAIGLGAGGLGKGARGFALGIAFVTLTVGLLWLIGVCRFDQPGAIAAPSLNTILPSLLLILTFLVQGSFEEVAMRGWIMPVFAKRYGLVVGVIVSTAMFALGHVINIPMSPELVLGIINVVFAGLFLAFYAITERSLWGPCGWHAAWNWMLGQGLGLSVSGTETGAPSLLADMAPAQGAGWWLTGGSFGPEASIVTTAVLAIGIAYWARKMPRRTAYTELGAPALT